MQRAAQIVEFWTGLDDEMYFTKNPEFDADLRVRFSDDIEHALAGEYDDWLGEPEGSLAVVLLLDQMTRNVFRGHGQNRRVVLSTLHAFRKASRSGTICRHLHTAQS